MKIRRRDGTLAEVDDAYVLKDGEALLVEAMFMDARRDMIHDARGQPAGTRPGFLFADNENERAVAAAYKEYDEVLFNRWRTAGGRQDQTTPSAPQTAPQTYNRPEAARDAVAAAYAEYDEVLFNRWRGK